MTDQTPDQEEPLAPSSVPPTCQLSLRGLGSDEEWNRRFLRAINDLVVGCGRFMDLRLLEGVTIGFDYDDALASVDLGYESTIAKQYTNGNGLIGVGKLLRVKRDDGIKCHVVINGECLLALADHEHELFWPTANILAHELAHVAVVAWFEAHSPGLMLAPHQGDWATAVLRDAAHTIWEEYAACRLSASFSSGEVVTDNYVTGLERSADGAISRAHESIKSYRTHHDVSRLLIEVSTPVANPLKMAAYLFGHLDGLECGEFDLEARCPVAASSEFGPLLVDLQAALRDAWDSRLDWNGLEGVDGIVRVIVAALAAAGAVVTLSQSGNGSRVDVPFSAETMPNGEEDMAFIRLMGGVGFSNA
jgi:hypothetical protein